MTPTRDRAERCYGYAFRDGLHHHIIDAIDREIREAVDEALEEAEHECQREAARNGPTDRQIGAENCAERIQRLKSRRSLKSVPPQATGGEPSAWFRAAHQGLERRVIALESRLAGIAKAAGGAR